MVQKFQFSMWSELSSTEQDLVREWVGLALKGRQIREALIQEATGTKADIEAIKINEAEAFDIVGTDEAGITMPLEIVAPRVATFITVIRQLSACEDACERNGGDVEACKANCRLRMVALLS